MKTFNYPQNLFAVFSIMLFLILGCTSNSSDSKSDWTKARKIAGKEAKLSHISGIAVDEKFAYVTIGGTVADQNEGTSGLRKIALNTGVVTSLENGENMPQSETGGIALDDKYVYWNGGNKILRISKDGGKPEPIASENVGIGLDMLIDGDKIYWANHGYYSPNSPTKPSPVYVVSKQGGKPEIFADAQNIPGNLTSDDQFIYWTTVKGIVKQPKAGGPLQVVYQATDKENVDKLAADADNLYFGFRGAGESRWALRKISKQGGEPQTLVKEFSLKPFVLDDAGIYFFGEEGMSNDSLNKISKSGGEASKLDTGYASGVITQSKTQIFFASLDDVFSLAK